MLTFKELHEKSVASGYANNAGPDPKSKENGIPSAAAATHLRKVLFLSRPAEGPKRMKKIISIAPLSATKEEQSGHQGKERFGASLCSGLRKHPYAAKIIH
jgi:hypothetical protein